MASPADIHPPVDAPEGTCEPVRDHAPWWFVRGRQDWHLVNAETGECDCGDWTFRCVYTRNLCRHGRRLKKHLEEMSACPWCQGRGWLVPSGAVRYVDRNGQVDMSPLACISCSGTGRKSGGEERKEDAAG